MLYSGQLDIIVAAPLTEEMLWQMPWRYQQDYRNAKKIVWKVNPKDTEVAGYVRSVHNFTQVCEHLTKTYFSTLVLMKF